MSMQHETLPLMLIDRRTDKLNPFGTHVNYTTPLDSHLFQGINSKSEMAGRFAFQKLAASRIFESTCLRSSAWDLAPLTRHASVRTKPSLYGILLLQSKLALSIFQHCLLFQHCSNQNWIFHCNILLLDLNCHFFLFFPSQKLLLFF